MQDQMIGRALGQYQIETLIGRGGMATVYRARQASVQRDVAIKIITERGEPNSPFIERFTREVSIIAKLEHIHVLPIYDYGEFEGHPYLVMRYLDGGSLNSRIGQKSLDLGTINRLIVQICSALDYAHERGVIHRDMKPHNVLLDKQGNAYICDFGIAKIVGGEHALTRTGEAVGTPSYMAPEQWQGLSVDRYADVYALGAVLYELLTGTPPFSAENVFTLMYKHLNEPPPLLDKHRADLPPALDMVIQKAMAKQPAERYASAGELAEAVSAAILETTAPPVSTPGAPLIRPVVADASEETDVVNVRTGPFAGRAWVLDAFEAWREASSESPIFFLVGPHGIGKTTLANRFVDLLSGYVLRYELVASQARSLDPRAFVDALANQLGELSLHTTPHSAGDTLREVLIDPADAFDQRVLEPLSAHSGPIYLVIDSLDAAFDHPGTTIVDLIQVAMENWPEPLRMIVTSAPHPRINALFRNATWLELDPDSDENRADLRATLSTRFATLLPNLSRGEIDLLALEEKSEGNPLYLNTVLEHLVHKRLQPGELADLPVGLDALYADLVRRAEAADSQATLLLCVLAAARAPLSEKLLAEILGEPIPKVKGHLLALRPLAQASGTGWKLAHPALRYWLIETHEHEILEAHRRIAEALMQRGAAQMDIYALQHLPTHFTLAQQPGLAYALLIDLNFLSARLARLSLAEVVDDYNLVRTALGVDHAESAAQVAALDAVLEALCNVVPALVNDPAGVFAQLYNTLSGVPALSEALNAAAEKRHAPWLRLIWPQPVAGQPGGTLVWQGEPVLALAAAGPCWLAACGDGRLRLWEHGRLRREWTAHSTEKGIASLTSCALSPDGKLALSGAEDRAVRLWDLERGECVQVFQEHGQAVTGCALSENGQYALTASDDRLLRLWEVRTGKLVQAFYEHEAPVRCCAFARGDELALSGSADGVLYVWSVRDNILRWALKQHRGMVTACAASPPGIAPPMAASGASDGSVCVWDMQTGALLHTLAGANGGITAVAVGEYDGRAIVAAASEDRTVRAWELPQGQPIARFDGHAQAVLSCALTADGHILSGAMDNTLRAWALEAATPHPAVEMHGARVNACAFTSDSTRLVTASLDRALRLWDAAEGRTLRILKGHTGSVNACAIRADNRVLLSASSDRTLRLWDANRGSALRMLTGHNDSVLACAFSPRPFRVADRRQAVWLAASGSNDRTLRLWDADSGQMLMMLKGHQDAVTACAFSPGDELVASASKDRSARLWSLESGEPVAVLQNEHGSAGFTTCAFSADGALLLLGLEDGQLWLFDRGTSKTDRIGMKIGGAIVACGLSANGRLLFAVSADGMAQVWDVQKSNLLVTFHSPYALTSGALAPDDVTFAVGDERGTVSVLRLEGQPGARRKRSLL